jgi:23S rRNA pseudouridine1911/1915/1917 synthase
LWAKTAKAARRLSAQFERRQVRKEYWAISEVHEQPGMRSQGAAPDTDALSEGTWTDWLTSPGVPGVALVVAAGAPGSRLAVTRFRCEPASGLAADRKWLRLWPETGRTHQLRVQAAARGLPIIGDSTYGAREAFAPGIALHARSLQLRHPILGTPLELIAPLPPSWDEFGALV